MSLIPLALTDTKPGQGTAILARGKYWYGPHCSLHGAMNRVTSDKDWWRCLSCNIGVEWDRSTMHPFHRPSNNSEASD